LSLEYTWETHFAFKMGKNHDSINHNSVRDGGDFTSIEEV